MPLAAVHDDRWEGIRAGVTPAPDPTDPLYEDSEGRMAVWLDPEHVEWLAARCLCGPDRSGSEPHSLECRYIRMRLTAALHKAGLKKPGTGLRRT